MQMCAYYFWPSSFWLQDVLLQKVASCCECDWIGDMSDDLPPFEKILYPQKNYLPREAEIWIIVSVITSCAHCVPTALTGSCLTSASTRRSPTCLTTRAPSFTPSSCLFGQSPSSSTGSGSRQACRTTGTAWGFRYTFSAIKIGVYYIT